MSRKAQGWSTFAAAHSRISSCLLRVVKGPGGNLITSWEMIDEAELFIMICSNQNKYMISYTHWNS